MSTSSFKKLVGILKKQKIFFLTISGGEPFLHPEINELLRFAHEKFEYVTVLSNGTTITKKNLDCMHEIIELKGYFPMQVSFDAADADTNDKTRGMGIKVRENLEILSNAGVSLTIAIVISSQNIDNITQTIISLRHLTRHFHLMPFKSVPYLDQKDQYLKAGIMDLELVWEELQKIRDEYDLFIKLPTDECCESKYIATGAPCVAGFTQVVIDPNLDVRACSRCTHSLVGNLEEESMESIWHGPRLAHIYHHKVPYCHVSSEWEEFKMAEN